MIGLPYQGVGIVGWGVAIPPKRVWAKTLAPIEKEPYTDNILGIRTKSVAQEDEDTITLSVDAVLDCFTQLETNHGQQKANQVRAQIGALFIGSESHPYAVKPTGSVVASAVGLPFEIACADLQFACKAGTQAILQAVAYVASGLAAYALAIGADVAQAEKKDTLAHSAGVGAAAYLIGAESIHASLKFARSVCSDTPDFWRKPGHQTPQHAGRFTGEPSYFRHVVAATQSVLQETGLSPQDFRYAVFHTPNGNFPLQAAKRLGFSVDQVRPGLQVVDIGNAYAGAVPIAFANTLSSASFGDRVLVTSYGSGAGSDCMIWEIA